MPPPLGATPLPLGPGKNVALAGRGAMNMTKMATQAMIIIDSNVFWLDIVAFPISLQG